MALLMSTHNIYFCREVRKPYSFFVGKNKQTKTPAPYLKLMWGIIIALNVLSPNILIFFLLLTERTLMLLVTNL